MSTIVAQSVNPELTAVATGHADAGQPFAITLAAYAVGREDAASGDPFAPEMLYVKPQDMYDYAIGFLSARPDCVAAEDVAKRFEQADYDLMVGYEPPYVPVDLDFEVEW